MGRLCRLDDFKWNDSYISFILKEFNVILHTGEPKVPLLPTYLRTEPKFRKTVKNVFSQFEGDFFWFNCFSTGVNFKISKGKVGLITYP